MNFHYEHAFCYGWIQGLFLLFPTALGFPYSDDAKDRQELTWLFQLHQGAPPSWLLGET